jgi:hypothetical protein
MTFRKAVEDFEDYARRASLPVFGTAVVMARPRLPFVLSAAANCRRRTHLVDKVATAWTRGELRRMTASTRCGARFYAARLLKDVPDEYALCDACVFTDFVGGASVYRLFDEAGRLLYVGCSKQLFYRVLSHGSGALASWWWPAVASVTYESYADPATALAVEARAIIAEQPLYNTDLTDRAKHPRRRRTSNLHLIPSEVTA